MDNIQILPQIDMAKLQEKANEFAMIGATETLKEFYTGYNSPYKKALEENLNNKGVGNASVTIPDIIGVLNDAISTQIHQIANAAIAQSWLPTIKEFLTRIEGEVRLSEILQVFINDNYGIKPGDCTLDLNEDKKHGWVTMDISAREKSYSFTLHLDEKSRKEKLKRYCILSLPNLLNNRRNDLLKMTVEDAVIEMPFTQMAMNDSFNNYIARLVISRTIIILDCDDFSSEMFTDECHCH